jgi:hypothetical protein
MASCETSQAGQTQFKAAKMACALQIQVFAKLAGCKHSWTGHRLFQSKCIDRSNDRCNHRYFCSTVWIDDVSTILLGAVFDLGTEPALMYQKGGVLALMIGAVLQILVTYQSTT